MRDPVPVRRPRRPARARDRRVVGHRARVRRGAARAGRPRRAALPLEPRRRRGARGAPRRERAFRSTPSWGRRPAAPTPCGSPSAAMGGLDLLVHSAGIWNAGADRDDDRGEARGDVPRERVQRVLPRARGAAARCASGAGARRGRVRRLHGRPARRGRPLALRRVEGSAPVARDVARGGARAGGAGEPGLAGLDPDADGRAGARDRRWAAPSSRRSRTAAWARSRTSSTPSCTSRARRRGTSSARTSASPAARCSSCRAGRSSRAADQRDGWARARSRLGRGADLAGP